MPPDPFRIVSAFDGIGGARVAAQRAGLLASPYYSSEIDKSALRATRQNHPDVVELGNVSNVRGTDPRLYESDLFVMGSPCQGLSRGNAGGQGLFDARSGLFHEGVRLRNEMQPKWWLAENVKPKNPDDLKRMSEALGVEPRYYDSAEFGPARRERYYWTNIPELPYGPGTARTAWDVIPNGPQGPELQPHQLDYMYRRMGDRRGSTAYGKHTARLWKDPKFGTVVADARRGVPYNTYQLEENGPLYFLSPEESLDAMGFPRDYLRGFAKTRALEMTGNSFDINTVAHILRGIPQEMVLPKNARERIVIPEGSHHMATPSSPDDSWSVFQQDPDLAAAIRRLAVQQGPFVTEQHSNWTEDVDPADVRRTMPEGMQKYVQRMEEQGGLDPEDLVMQPVRRPHPWEEMPGKWAHDPQTAPNWDVKDWRDDLGPSAFEHGTPGQLGQHNIDKWWQQQPGREGVAPPWASVKVTPGHPSKAMYYTLDAQGNRPQGTEPQFLPEGAQVPPRRDLEMEMLGRLTDSPWTRPRAYPQEWLRANEAPEQDVSRGGGLSAEEVPPEILQAGQEKATALHRMFDRYRGGQMRGASNIPTMMAEGMVGAARNPALRGPAGLGAMSALTNLAQQKMRTGEIHPGEALRAGAEGTLTGGLLEAPNILAASRLAQSAPWLGKLASAMPAVGGGLVGMDTADAWARAMGHAPSAGETGLGALLAALIGTTPVGAGAEMAGALASLPMDLATEYYYSQPQDVFSDALKARLARLHSR